MNIPINIHICIHLSLYNLKFSSNHPQTHTCDHCMSDAIVVQIGYFILSFSRAGLAQGVWPHPRPPRGVTRGGGDEDSGCSGCAERGGGHCNRCQVSVPGGIRGRDVDLKTSAGNGRSFSSLKLAEVWKE